LAKKQTFGDKVGKGNAKSQQVHIKLVKSYRSNVNDSIRFSDEIVGIPSGEDITEYLKKHKIITK